jgi:hypothetical protein
MCSFVMRHSTHAGALLWCLWQQVEDVDCCCADIVLGKRKRHQVDYAALNAIMFGDYESYEGEADDGDYS